MRGHPLSLTLTFHTLRWVCIFSVPFSIHFLTWRHGEFVYQSRPLVGDHFLHYRDLTEWFRVANVRRKEMVVTLTGQRVSFSPVCVLSSSPWLERSNCHLGKRSENKNKGNIFILEFLFSLSYLAQWQVFLKRRIISVRKTQRNRMYDFPETIALSYGASRFLDITDSLVILRLLGGGVGGFWMFLDKIYVIFP